MNAYEQLFLKVLDMSLTGSFVILGVAAVRLLLKRAPKIYAYVLWSIVAFRLLVPFALPSPFSLVPVRSEAITYDNLAYGEPEVNTGLAQVDLALNRTLGRYAAPAPYQSANPMQAAILFGAVLWGLTALSLFGYGVGNYLRLKRKLSTAVIVERGKTNVYETDRLDTPILLGILRPAVYLPLGLDGKSRAYVVEHELVHVARKDHLIKVLAYAALAVHWFNPLAWFSFFLMTKDMEMSCDEKVMCRKREDARVEYSRTLLKLAVRQSRWLSLSPLAFGENDTKARVKNVLAFRKPLVWVAACCVLAVGITGCALLTEKSPEAEESAFGAGGTLTNTAFGEEDNWIQDLCDRRTPYVGKPSPDGEVVELLGFLFPEGTEAESNSVTTQWLPFRQNLTFAGPAAGGYEMEKVLYKSGAILFATTGNIGRCILDWRDEKGRCVEVELSRAEMEKKLGITDLYDVSENRESMAQFLNDVENLLETEEIAYTETIADKTGMLKLIKDIREKIASLEEEYSVLETEMESVGVEPGDYWSARMEAIKVERKIWEQDLMRQLSLYEQYFGEDLAKTVPF